MKKFIYHSLVFSILAFLVLAILVLGTTLFAKKSFDYSLPENKNILVIGSEYHSRGLHVTTRGRGVSVIFGDGAGAAILSRSDDASRGILSSHDPQTGF